EETYAQWIKRYILFHGKRHPKDMGRLEIESFLTDLAVNQHVAASTQNQALNALLFLYHKVLGIEIDGINAVRANQPRNLPVVLTKAEVGAVIPKIDGRHQLVVKLLYGSGLRLSEALRLRIKDIDFAQQQLIIRDGKGRKNRVTMLPASIISELQDYFDIRTIQELLGHKDVKTTMIYTHVLNRGGRGVH
ncbi:MAG: phage integrase N-terminal SAM-like domain-containing protein, partial [Cyanobacteria bacterium J06639_14]